MPPPLPLPPIFANPYLAAMGLWSAFIWAPILNFWNRFEAFLFPVDYFIHAAGEGQPLAPLGIDSGRQDSRPPQADQSREGSTAGEDVPPTPPAEEPALPRRVKHRAHRSETSLNKLPTGKAGRVAGAAVSPGVDLPPAYAALLARHGGMDFDGLSRRLGSAEGTPWGNNGQDQAPMMLFLAFYLVCGYFFLLLLNRFLAPRTPRQPLSSQQFMASHREDSAGQFGEAVHPLNDEKYMSATPISTPNTPSDAFITSDEDSSDFSYALSTCGTDRLEDEREIEGELVANEGGMVADPVRDEDEGEQVTESDEDELSIEAPAIAPAPARILAPLPTRPSSANATPSPVLAPSTPPRPYRFFDDIRATPGPGPTTMDYRSALAARALHVVPARSSSARTRPSGYVPRQKLSELRKRRPQRLVKEETEKEKRKRVKAEEKKAAKLVRRAARKEAGEASAAAAAGALPNPVSLV
ncbi:hypothetical protein IAT38_002594 [Cryptococcus sp. DSM 104549]